MGGMNQADASWFVPNDYSLTIIGYLCQGTRLLVLVSFNPVFENAGTSVKRQQGRDTLPRSLLISGCQTQVHTLAFDCAVLVHRWCTSGNGHLHCWVLLSVWMWCILGSDLFATINYRPSDPLSSDLQACPGHHSCLKSSITSASHLESQNSGCLVFILRPLLHRCPYLFMIICYLHLSHFYLLLQW